MATRYLTPSSSAEFTLQGGPLTDFPTGLVGTLGVRVDTGAGATAVARATAGIVEEGVAIYVATITMPATEGTYVVIWDNGSGSEVAEEDTIVVVGNLPGTGLISIDDLDDRGITYSTTAQAQAAIDDASAVARSYTEPVLDDVATPVTPAAIVVVVVAMVRRVLTNPNGLAMEVLGDYTYQTQNNVATLLPTARERRMLRKAAATYALANDIEVPPWGTGGVFMETNTLPAGIQDELGL